MLFVIIFYHVHWFLCEPQMSWLGCADLQSDLSYSCLTYYRKILFLMEWLDILSVLVSHTVALIAFRV